MAQLLDCVIVWAWSLTVNVTCDKTLLGSEGEYNGSVAIIGFVHVHSIVVSHGRDLSISDGRKVDVNTPRAVSFCPLSRRKSPKGSLLAQNGRKGD